MLNAKEVLKQINNNIDIATLDKEALKQTASLELLNLQGKNNQQIISLSLIANSKNFNYDGNNLKTYAQWKKSGYQVQKGQKAFLQCELWTPCKAKLKNTESEQVRDKENKKEYTRMFLKKSSLFTLEQVKAV